MLFAQNYFYWRSASMILVIRIADSACFIFDFINKRAATRKIVVQSFQKEDRNYILR
jgi:hypothetical protein